MWIAKNSLTNKTYGPKFNSIYDCQAFIDNSLKLLEYEFQRCFSLENEFIEEYEFYEKSKGKTITEQFGLRISFAINAFTENNKEKLTELKNTIHETLFKDKLIQRDIDSKLINYAQSNFLKNNIIRCYNTDQERFADGFDF